MPVTLDNIKPSLSQWKDYGSYISAVCPFHSDSKPSLMIYKEDKFFRCLACGTTGNYEKLFRKLKGWTPTAPRGEGVAWKPPIKQGTDYEELSLKAFQRLSKNIETLGWYLKDRGVLDRVEANQLGYHQGWYTIPVFDAQATWKGIVLRASPVIQKVNGHRFWMPHGQPVLPFCPDYLLLERSHVVFVVFGMFDALVLSSLRYPVVTTTSGKSSFNVDWLDKYRKPIVFLPDLGEEADAERYARKLEWRGNVHYLQYQENEKDPADMGKTIAGRQRLEKELEQWMQF